MVSFVCSYLSSSCIYWARKTCDRRGNCLHLSSESQPSLSHSVGTIEMVRSQRVRAVISQIVHLCEFCNSCDHSPCAFFSAFDDVTLYNSQYCSPFITAMKSPILSLVKPNWQRFHTYFFLVIRRISLGFHFLTTFMKQLSYFRTVIHLNIDIACVHASPKELVPNGLRIDVPLLIYPPPLIISLLSVVVVPSGGNLNSPPIWKITLENNQQFWLQQLAMLGSNGTPNVWQDQNFEKYQCQNFF